MYKCQCNLTYTVNLMIRLTLDIISNLSLVWAFLGCCCEGNLKLQIYHNMYSRQFLLRHLKMHSSSVEIQYIRDHCCLLLAKMTILLMNSHTGHLCRKVGLWPFYHYVERVLIFEHNIPARCSYSFIEGHRFLPDG